MSKESDILKTFVFFWQFFNTFDCDLKQCDVIRETLTERMSLKQQHFVKNNRIGTDHNPLKYLDLQLEKSGLFSPFYFAK